MSLMQQVVLKSYFDTFGKLSLRKISENTGIQTTRVFRIMNGSEMKLSEYERFENSINHKSKGLDVWEKMIKESKQYLSEFMLLELGDHANRLINKRKIYMGLLIK